MGLSVKYIYKWMSRSRVCLKVITECMNRILRDGEIPNLWRQTKTVLIPKKGKPKSTDMRPISLNITSYKLFMSLAKDKIFSHMQEQECILELQTGFTKGKKHTDTKICLLYTSPSPRDKRQSRMPSSA